MARNRVLEVLSCCLFASLAWGQSMTSQKTVSTWNAPTIESIFKHCSPNNEAQNCWISIPGTAVWISSNAGHTVAVDSSGNGYVYNDGKANNWTKHPEWGKVKEISYDYNGLLYGLVHYVSAGRGYSLSKWTGTAWTDESCCFQSFRMRYGVMVAYDINGTIWTSTNSGSTVKSQPWCDPEGPTAVAPAGLDANGNATFYVACNTGKIWYFDGTYWGQLPGSATAISLGSPGTNPYIVASNGNVQHWNGTGWDDIVTNTPVTSLSVGGAFNIWMIGPKAANGSPIWRTWEKGALLTHSYGGSVSCGQGVPQALCNTFTHKLHHQICYGGHCGPVAQSSWSGQGGWGPDAQVFATPYDLWTCLLAGEPAGPCGAAENEANMECSGGGSNQDNAGGVNWVAGLSIDVQAYTANTGSNSGPMHVMTSQYNGYWLGTVSNYITEDCYPSDPVPYCVALNPETSDVKATYWGGLNQSAEAYSKWWKYYDNAIAGGDADYVYYTFFIGDETANGAIINQVCLGNMHDPDDFMFGKDPPHCQ